MTEELDVLRIISERLRAADIPFMLTGSFALGYYGKPRMTRDLDFVVALMERHIDALVSAFSTDFYIDEDAARSAIKSQRMFNLMHLESAIKVDLIIRKNSEYRHAEFERRKSVEFARNIDVDYEPRRPDSFEARLGTRLGLGDATA